MIWLARKAFFGRVPCPVMHVDTGKKFPEMYAFRDRYSKEWQLDLLVEPCPPIEAVDPTLPPAARSAARKTEGLKLALAKHGFDGLIAGIRRDEEPLAPRSAYSPRAAPRACGRARPAARVLEPLQTPRRRRARTCACIRSCIGPKATSGLYAARRHSDHPPLSGARRQALRSLGDMDITSPMTRMPARSTRSSPSSTPPKSERSGRAMDHESEDAFERLRKAGYL